MGARKFDYGEHSMSEHGWGAMNAGAFRTQMTLDLDRAFAALKSTPAERILIQHIREESWNRAIRTKLTSKDAWPDPVPCVLNLSELATSTGVPYRTLRRAKSDLYDDRIIIHMGHGMTVNKNVYQWSRSRISRQEIEYAKQAQRVQHPRVKVSRPISQPNTGINIHMGQIGDDFGQSAVKPAQNENVDRNLAHIAPHMSCPPDSNGGFTDSAVLLETGERGRAGEEDFSSSIQFNSPLLTTPTVERFLTGGGGGVGEGMEREPGEKIPENLGQLSAWAVRRSRGTIKAENVEVLASGFPIDWVYESLRLGMLNFNEARRILTYANSMLYRWRRDGGMRLAKAEEPTILPAAAVNGSRPNSEYLSSLSEGAARRKARRAKEANGGSD